MSDFYNLKMSLDLLNSLDDGIGYIDGERIKIYSSLSQRPGHRII